MFLKSKVAVQQVQTISIKFLHVQSRRLFAEYESK